MTFIKSAHPIFISDLDEVRGPLLSIEEADGNCLAQIGKILVLLPGEMTARLQGLKGKAVGVLKIDGSYRVKEC